MSRGPSSGPATSTTSGQPSTSTSCRRHTGPPTASAYTRGAMAQALRDLVELAVVVDDTFDQNCYVLRRRDTDEVVVFDPGLQHRRLLDLLDRRGQACARILLTHGHPDHVNGVPAVRAAHRCSAAIHPDDREQLPFATML